MCRLVHQPLLAALGWAQLLLGETRLPPTGGANSTHSRQVGVPRQVLTFEALIFDQCPLVGFRHDYFSDNRQSRTSHGHGRAPRPSRDL